MSYTNVISLLPIRFRNKYIVLKSYKAEGFIMARDSIKDGRNGSFRIRSNGRVECRFRYIDEFGRTKVKSISGGNKEDCVKRANEWVHNYKESVKKIDQSATIPEILKKK